jgi:hypothetical protein
MFVLIPPYRPWLRGFVVTILFSSLAFLGGCANLGDGPVSGAFVDPSKYDFYDCKLLEGERKSLDIRAGELQGLMDKAQSGVAGPVVAELAYRNDYISVRAQSKLAEEAWRRNKCQASPPAPAPATPAPPTNAKGSRSRSGNAVH